MVVILAGCDGTGKSTCFNKLKQSVDANFIKESYTKDVEAKRLRALFTASKINDNDLTIYDRATVLDDLVYDPVIANQESMLVPMMGKGSLNLFLFGCLIIYFDLDDYEITRRLEKRKDDYITVHQVNKIKNSYQKVFNDFNLDPVKINVTGLSEDQVYEVVKEVIYRRYEEFKNR